MLAAPNGPRSTRIDHDSNTSIPAEAKLRPLRDQIIVEPLNRVHSHLIVTREDMKPVRGIVKAVGPGHYPKVYDHPDKGRRTKMWDSEVFQPTSVKSATWWSLAARISVATASRPCSGAGVKHVICREMDVSGVIDGMTADQAREEAARCTA